MKELQIGYRVLKKKGSTITKAELLEVSIVPNRKWKANVTPKYGLMLKYLRRILPPAELERIKELVRKLKPKTKR